MSVVISEEISYYDQPKLVVYRLSEYTSHTIWLFRECKRLEEFDSTRLLSGFL